MDMLAVHGLATAEEKTMLDTLEENCRQVVAVHGASAPECGEAYLAYGLDTEVDDGREEEGEDEEESDTDTNGIDGDKENEATNDQVVRVNAREENITDSELRDEEEEDVTNLEVAYEVLIGAVAAFRGQLKDANQSSDRSIKLLLADSLLKLGEVLLEWRNGRNALSIISEAVNIREEYLADDDRLAEAYYLLAVAQGLTKQDSDKDESFLKCLAVAERNWLSRQLQGMEMNETEILNPNAANENDLVVRLRAAIDEFNRNLLDKLLADEAIQSEIKSDSSFLATLSAKRKLADVLPSQRVKKVDSGASDAKKARK